MEIILILILKLVMGAVILNSLIRLPVNKEKRGFILELKLVKDKDLYDTAIEGCDQIVEKRYMESEKVRGYQDIVGYGIAFDKKRCFIKMVKD